MTVRSSVSILVFSSAGLLAAGGAAQADSCVDLRTSQVYDCAKEPPSGKPPAQASKTTQTLREQLSRSLADKANAPPAPDRVAIAQRAEAASQRADSALRSAQLTSDPTEKAQAKKAYETAMADLRSSTRQLIAATPDTAQKQTLTQALTESEQRHASMAAEVGLTGAPAAPAAPAPEVAAAPPPSVFSVCEPPEKGVTTCYEIGKAGSACQKVFYQGGQLTWRDPQMSTCNAGDLAQRDAFYAGRPVGGDATPPAIDPRSQQLAGLMSSVSPQCQSDLKAYLYGARDSKGSANAQTNAMRSFAGINRDPECKAALDRLASTAGVEMPQRRLAARSRSAWDSAMADKPAAEIAVPTDFADGSAGGGGWNTGEVLDAGIQILGVLSGILGAASAYSGGGYTTPTYTSRPVGAARTYGQGSPSGSGYVYRNNSGSNSTITGTGR